ncbi:MAG: DUF6715 family protein [Lachnospirales bacterium]
MAYNNNGKRPLFYSALMSFILILVFVGIFFVGLKSRIESNANKNDVSEAERLLSVNLETDYPKGPEAVVTYYYEIFSYMYGGNSDVTYTSELVWQMRSLFTQELMSLNPYEMQKENALNEIVESQTTGVKILDARVENAYYDELNNNIAYVEVKEYWTGIRNKSVNYALYLEDGKWKIQRWDSKSVD